MRCSISKALTPAKLTAAVPARYRPQLPELSAGVYTLMKFRSGREDVVLSKVVKSALAGVDGPEQLVAVGGTFTLEAQALLKARQAIILELSDWCWSDERYVSIRTGRAAH